VVSDISFPYVTGVSGLVSPSGQVDWDLLSTATILARATPQFGAFIGNGVIVANQGTGYRGLYFSNYLEDKADGANQQDMQVFYNGLVWTAGLPEPASALLLLAGSAGLTRRRAARRLG
jgi:hypothetical protein